MPKKTPKLEKQDFLRKRVLKYIDTYGATRVFIAESIGIHKDTLRKFMHRYSNLTPNNEKKLKEFLNERK